MIEKPEGFLWCPKLDGFLHITACRSRRAQAYRCPSKCYVKTSLEAPKRHQEMRKDSASS